MRRHLGAPTLGVAAGFVGGLLGVGGGVVIVPGVVLLMAFDQHRAHATSVAAIVAAASAAVVPFAMDGSVQWAFAGWLLIGAVAGASVGARQLDKIPEVWLARAFVALLVVAALRIGHVEPNRLTMAQEPLGTASLRPNL